MVEHSDIHLPSGGHSDVDGLLDLADAAVAALGLSSSAATALEQALEVRTVRDLADNKYVRRAQAIVKLADEKRHGEVSLSPVGACPGEPAEAMGVVAGSRGASNPTPASHPQVLLTRSRKWAPIRGRGGCLAVLAKRSPQ
jgi:hypothetical protein